MRQMIQLTLPLAFHKTTFYVWCYMIVCLSDYSFLFNRSYLYPLWYTYPPRKIILNRDHRICCSSWESVVVLLLNHFCSHCCPYWSTPGACCPLSFNGSTTYQMQAFPDDWKYSHVVLSDGQTSTCIYLFISMPDLLPINSIISGTKCSWIQLAGPEMTQ